MKLYIYLLIGVLPFISFSQEKVEGMIMEANPENKHIGLPGANVYWMNSQTGTITNDEGLFSIPFSKEYNKLIISYVGFKSDTLTITKPKMLHHSLRPSNELDEVVVEQERKAIQKNVFQCSKCNYCK